MRKFLQVWNSFRCLITTQNNTHKANHLHSTALRRGSPPVYVQNAWKNTEWQFIVTSAKVTFLVWPLCHRESEVLEILYTLYNSVQLNAMQPLWPYRVRQLEGRKLQITHLQWHCTLVCPNARHATVSLFGDDYADRSVNMPTYSYVGEHTKSGSNALCKGCVRE